MVLALLLIPVSRQTVTVLRNTPLRHIIPFGTAAKTIWASAALYVRSAACNAALSLTLLTRADESISIHRWFGKMIGICSLGHFFCHINNYIKLVSFASPSRLVPPPACRWTTEDPTSAHANTFPLSTRASMTSKCDY